MQRKFFVLLLLILFSAEYADAAGIQKWVDADGKVHYGEKPPAEHDSEQVEASISVVDSAAPAGDRVVLYTTAWCGYCKKARRYLNAKGISYREYDIEKNSAAKRRYERAGGRGVPYLVRGDDSLSGYAPNSYDRFFADQ